MVLTAARASERPRAQKRRPSARRFDRVTKPLVFVGCLLPLAWLVGQAVTGGLGANPIEATNRFLGDWALRFLLLTLALTPLKEITGWTLFVRIRRMVGLFAFFYVCLHLASYVGLDQFFAWGEIWKDIVKRQYITIGMIAFVMLIPLAVTSTSAMIKRLGAKRWKLLHRLVYPAAILGVLHFFLMVKADIREPLVYAAVLSLLLGYRLVMFLRRRAQAAGSGPGADPTRAVGSNSR